MKNLCETIHNHTGADGKELMAYVFFVYAIYADYKKDKVAGDYFSKRCNECWEEHKNESRGGRK